MCITTELPRLRRWWDSTVSGKTTPKVIMPVPSSTSYCCNPIPFISVWSRGKGGDTIPSQRQLQPAKGVSAHHKHQDNLKYCSSSFSCSKLFNWNKGPNFPPCKVFHPFDGYSKEVMHGTFFNFSIKVFPFPLKTHAFQKTKRQGHIMLPSPSQMPTPTDSLTSEHTPLAVITSIQHV